MVKIVAKTFILLVVLAACNETASKKATEVNSTTIAPADSTAKDDESVYRIPDSIKRFVVDDYPVPDSLLYLNAGDDRRIKVGEIFSVDKAWLRNDSLDQTLVFEMYTDGFRNIIFHFLNNDIPDQLIDRVELHVESGDTATFKQQKTAFKGFIKKAAAISNGRYFITNKGIKLGDDMQKALDTYGRPHQLTRAGDIEILDWEYIGDQIYNGEQDLRGRPLAKDSYGHQVRMFFRNKKLIAYILHNDIP